MGNSRDVISSLTRRETALPYQQTRCLMPRLSTKLLRQARQVDPFLVLLLRPCRELTSARNELRWLTEFVSQRPPSPAGKSKPTELRKRLRKLCEERGRGKPLQYILGTEHFGELELICEPGVLIPRRETAASVTHLVSLLARGAQTHRHPEPLRVLDLCTGSGCIPLLFHHLHRQISPPRPCPNILGIDISGRACDLAFKNLRRTHGHAESRPDIDFAIADVLARGFLPWEAPRVSDVLKTRKKLTWDIVIANPPYISPSSLFVNVERSVRVFEPKLALVPPMPITQMRPLRTRKPDPLFFDFSVKLAPRQRTSPKHDFYEVEDTFYHRIIGTAMEVHAAVMLMEVSSLGQALRVVDMLWRRRRWNRVEVWRDEPDQLPDEGEAELETVNGRTVPIRGRGNGRSVVCWTNEAGPWLGQTDVAA
ncbi:hypothetical protein MRB53_038703 [Persea americana]|nr:hypothetical protein MRB53_038703 [Persea americana]